MTDQRQHIDCGGPKSSGRQAVNRSGGWFGNVRCHEHGMHQPPEQDGCSQAGDNNYDGGQPCCKSAFAQSQIYLLKAPLLDPSNRARVTSGWRELARQTHNVREYSSGVVHEYELVAA